MIFLFRVDADSQVGTGHLMRCLALAQTLAEMRAEVIFYVSAETLPICKSRHDWVGRVFTIPKLSLRNEVDWLRERIKSHKASAVILDGYQFIEEYRAQLRRVIPLVLFDDLNNSGLLHTDLVINSAADAKQLGYSNTADSAVKCLGAEFRPLRHEFIDCDYNNWEGRKDLVVSFGGSDNGNFTVQMLNALENAQADMPIRVVTGPAYQHAQQLIDMLMSSSLLIQHVHNCQQMADVFCRAKLAICAAGGTQYELQACAAPSFLLIVADNQRPATEGASKQGWCEVVDGSKGLDFEAIAAQALCLWQDEYHLEIMHKRAIQVRNVDGCYRIAEAIKEMVNSH